MRAGNSQNNGTMKTWEENEVERSKEQEGFLRKVAKCSKSFCTRILCDFTAKGKPELETVASFRCTFLLGKFYPKMQKLALGHSIQRVGGQRITSTTSVLKLAWNS